MANINDFSCYDIDINKEQDKTIVENSDTFKMTEEHNYSILEKDKNDSYSNIDGTDRGFSKMKYITKIDYN